MSFISNLFGGGGGSSAPAQTAPQQTSSNVYQTNIPEYAQPYVQNMLNATQAQLFQTDANGNITGFNQYQPYTGMTPDQLSAAQAAVAGFSPLQQQAQSAAANLQVPGQYGQAAGITGIAASGALGTAGQAGMYGMQGARAGQQAAGMSNMLGMQSAMTGQQAGQQAGMYGNMGAMAGQQGANIGASLGQQSTNPSAVGAYMNPYIQNVLAPQQQLLNQQYGIAGTQSAGAATGAGAFGGSRNALQQSLNQQNQMLAQNQLSSNAYNTAYTNAQNQMNAANQAALSGNQQALTGYGMGLSGAQAQGQLGLQGLSQGLSAANQAGQLGISGAQAGLAGIGAQQAGYGLAGTQAQNLANIGGQQLAAQQGIIGTQAQQGALQQANAQQVINQAIQNYATAQQYPLMELGTMSNMLRGLPLQSATTQSYQAAPSALTQAVGAAGTGAMLGSLYGAKGGLPKDFKPQKGIKGFKKGGVVKRYGSGDVVESTEQDLNDMPTPDLNKELASTTSDTIKNKIRGILAARAGMPYTAAGGGIIAFADSTDENNQSLVSSIEASQPKDRSMWSSISDYYNSPSSWEGVKTNVANTLNALGPIGAEANVLGNKIFPATVGLATADESLKYMPYAESLARSAVRANALDTSGRAAGLGQDNQPNAIQLRPQGNVQAGAINTDVPQAIGINTVPPAQTGTAQSSTSGATPAATPAATSAAAPGQPGQAPTGAGINTVQNANTPTNRNLSNGDVLNAIEKHAAKQITERATDPNNKSWLDLIPTTSMKEGLAEREAYIGPSTVAQDVSKLEERRKQAEKTADQREKLIKAQMFAKMGTTPGSFIVAGLTGVQSAIPGLISNLDKRQEAMDHIDDAIANIYKADRLERAGNYDAVQKAQEKAIENTLKGHQIIFEHQDRQAKVGADLAKVGVDKSILQYQKAQGQYEAVQKDVSAAKAKDERYNQDLEMQALYKRQLAENPNNAQAKANLAAVNAKIAPKEAAWNARIEEARQYRDRFDTDKVPQSKTGTAQSKNDPLGLRG
jgi:hypothetical protein